MADHDPCRLTEIVGASGEGVGAAVRNGPARAQQCQRRLDGFEIHTNRPWNSDHAVGCSRVAMKVGFGLEE